MTLDCRLIGPAILSWFTAVSVLHMGSRTGVWTCVILVSVFATAAFAGWFVVAAAAIVAAAVAAVTAWSVVASESHWLRSVPASMSINTPAIITGDAVERAGALLVPAEIDSGAVVLRVRGANWDATPGEVLQVHGHPSPPLANDLTVAIIDVSSPPRVLESAPWWQRWATTVRSRFAEAVGKALPSESAGLLPALVVGDMTHVPPDVVTDMRTAGLSHLSSVSGANFSILLTAVLAIGRKVSLSPRATAALCTVALGFFVVLARPSPSVVRAAAMGGVGVLGLLVGRRKQALPALGAAVICLLAWKPDLAVSAGFLLSVVATAGLVVVAPGWSEWLVECRVPKFVADELAVATCAFLVTLPVIIGLTGTISVVSIAANVLVAAIVAPVTILGAVGALVSVVCQPLAVVVLWLTKPLMAWLLAVTHSAASFGTSNIEVEPSIQNAVAAAVGVALLLVVLAVRRSNSERRRTTSSDPR